MNLFGPEHPEQPRKSAQLADENIFSVSEITSHIKNILETAITPLWIKGEISNYKKHSSGHMYFTLKDEGSSLLCVFFRQFNTYLRFEPENGMEVICYGQIKVYERSGQYQLYINQMRPLGIGELEIAFRKLKEQLEEEGLFDEFHKKSIPEYPARIGIVTSPTGAAIQDMKNVLSRRFPVEIFLYPARVQGDGAAKEIADGIREFNTRKDVDVIIIGRGGGSIEDLWPFNEEIVAREIFASKIPIISAVGHETDFTIADFVTDLRAPTPSAAAELVVPERTALFSTLESYADRMQNFLNNRVREQSAQCRKLSYRLERRHPENVLMNFSQQLDDLQIRLRDSLDYLVDIRFDIEKMKIKFLQSLKTSCINNNEKLINDLTTQMRYAMSENYTKDHDRFINLSAKLEELNPLKILKSGYTLTKKGERILNTIKNVVVDDRLEIHFYDGTCKSSVTEVRKNPENEVQ
ncbi:MAG: exodeoxyribonuclease VII large subunit [Candidatus Celaenobacter antarcticus]|nr:exodeoxyribonuclease VII large subunit [Candidatus Celaenobacter antarcticus]